MLQFAHPLVAAGVAEHSAFRREPRGRLRRLNGTLAAMLQLTFGTAEEIEQVAQRINAIHDRVHGRLGEPAGAFPRGTPYSAHDPSLLCWVHCTLVESHLLAYELYVGPLTVIERDRYCEESAQLGRLLGIPHGGLPNSVEDLRAYMDEMYSSRKIVVTDMARALARDIVYPPTLGIGRPVFRLMRLSTLGLLPSQIREAYGFPWTPQDERALQRLAGALRILLPYMPLRLRQWRCARVASRALDRQLRFPHSTTLSWKVKG